MIIGLNLNHDYALCKLTETNLQLLEYERISRIRNHWIKPECYSLSILDDPKICAIEEIELLCLNSPKLKSIMSNGGDISSTENRYVYCGEYPGLENESFIRNGFVLFNDVQIPAVWISHYHAHAASGYYTSNFAEADILCLDGGGDFGYGAIFEANDDEIILHERLLDWHFGYSYNEFSRSQIGKQGFHEGKIMAMASYGNPEKYSKPIFDNSGNLEAMQFPVSVHAVAKMQYQFEQAVMNLLENKENRSKNLVCSGGCFLNVQLNRRLAESGLYENIYIPPYVGDMGTAIGAALIGAKFIEKKFLSPTILQTPFLGNELIVSEELILKKIQEFNYG